MNKSLLVARYLVENNNEEKLELNLKLSEKRDFIKCQLKTLIKRYELSFQKENDIKSEILAILTKYKGILVSIYNNISHHKKYIPAKFFKITFF